MAARGDHPVSLEDLDETRTKEDLDDVVQVNGMAYRLRQMIFFDNEEKVAMSDDDFDDDPHH